MKYGFHFGIMRHCHETLCWVFQVYTRLDQPNSVLDLFMKSADEQPGEVSLLLGAARIYDALNDMVSGVQVYKKVLLALPTPN